LVKDTVLIGPAERYDVELVANNPGVWMFHCHINNHAANGMVTSLTYEGAVPLAGGDHSAAHGPVATQTSATSPVLGAAPSASLTGSDGHADHGAAATPAPTPSTSPSSASADPASASLQQPPDDERHVQIAMRDDRFVASRMAVKAGTTVTWVNQGSNSHDTSSLDGLWSSGAFSRGESFSFTFDRPGTYAYLCKQHLLQGMRGTITVDK
jgi:plastocyanin